MNSSSPSITSAMNVFLSTSYRWHESFTTCAYMEVNTDSYAPSRVDLATEVWSERPTSATDGEKSRSTVHRFGTSFGGGRQRMSSGW